MSQGTSCKCPESKKPMRERRWFVLQRNSRCSAFDGYQHRFSDYSAVQCYGCGTVWRTKADFVLSLKDGKNVYDLPADQWPSGHTPLNPVEKHATVRVGEYTIPLIGVPPSATTEKCSQCGESRHLSELTLNEKGHPVCATCNTPPKTL